MSDHPFYITWTAQKKAYTLPIIGAKKGYFLTDENRKIYDLCSTSYQAAFGHSDKTIKGAIKKQLDQFSIASPKSVFDLKTTATNKLLELISLKGKIFYTVSGAESIENALKMCRQITGRKIILSRNNSYHGATLGALSVTGDWRNKDHLTVDQWTKRIPEPSNDPHALDLEKLILKIGPEKIAGFCLETITGGNGVIIPPTSWWKAIKRLQTKYNLMLILDEVICGFGRTEKHFGFQHFNLKPDFICMAKIITGGYIPFGAVWTSNSVAKYYKSNTLSCGLTNYAHPLALAAMEAVIDILNSKEHIVHFQKLLHVFENSIETFYKLENIKEIRQIGLLMAIDLKENISIEKFIEAGVLVASVKNHIVLAPPYCLSESELRRNLKIVCHVIKENYHE
ncbi:hypothetical protein A9Q84_17275 [Halobacteriovorax marinus]|uniref:Aspartate aminotransferase family protein n=1 Tax=Halobacteriovorax marinus TaxID=97084 RepID=A0A1Y5F3M6_9BACT|nr:hypothetical protein A9Q84_17275 [Halobacteriovorax marinus]